MMHGAATIFGCGTGTIEYLLRVAVADLEAYMLFHTDVLGTLPQVTAITSYVVMDSPKDERA
jgi:DNA-binding Lrp family transcriptional regulator